MRRVRFEDVGGDVRMVDEFDEVFDDEGNSGDKVVELWRGSGDDEGLPAHESDEPQDSSSHIPSNPVSPQPSNPTSPRPFNGGGYTHHEDEDNDEGPPSPLVNRDGVNYFQELQRIIERQEDDERRGGHGGADDTSPASISRTYDLQRHSINRCAILNNDLHRYHALHANTQARIQQQIQRISTAWSTVSPNTKITAPMIPGRLLAKSRIHLNASVTTSHEQEFDQNWDGSDLRNWNPNILEGLAELAELSNDDNSVFVRMMLNAAIWHRLRKCSRSYVTMEDINAVRTLLRAFPNADFDDQFDEVEDDPLVREYLHSRRRTIRPGPRPGGRGGDGGDNGGYSPPRDPRLNPRRIPPRDERGDYGVDENGDDDHGPRPGGGGIADGASRGGSNDGRGNDHNDNPEDEHLQDDDLEDPLVRSVSLRAQSTLNMIRDQDATAQRLSASLQSWSQRSPQQQQSQRSQQSWQEQQSQVLEQVLASHRNQTLQLHQSQTQTAIQQQQTNQLNQQLLSQNQAQLQTAITTLQEIAAAPTARRPRAPRAQPRGTVPATRESRRNRGQSPSPLPPNVPRNLRRRISTDVDAEEMEERLRTVEYKSFDPRSKFFDPNQKRSGSYGSKAYKPTVNPYYKDRGHKRRRQNEDEDEDGNDHEDEGEDEEEDRSEGKSAHLNDYSEDEFSPVEHGPVGVVESNTWEEPIHTGTRLLEGSNPNLPIDISSDESVSTEYSNKNPDQWIPHPVHIPTIEVIPPSSASNSDQDIELNDEPEHIPYVTRYLPIPYSGESLEEINEEIYDYIDSENEGLPTDDIRLSPAGSESEEGSYDESIEEVDNPPSPNPSHERKSSLSCSEGEENSEGYNDEHSSFHSSVSTSSSLSDSPSAHVSEMLDPHDSIDSVTGLHWNQYGPEHIENPIYKELDGSQPPELDYEDGEYNEADSEVYADEENGDLREGIATGEMGYPTPPRTPGDRGSRGADTNVKRRRRDSVMGLESGGEDDEEEGSGEREEGSGANARRVRRRLLLGPGDSVLVKARGPGGRVTE
ncbi:hypothetical protein B0J11DRAFT_505854 [Dendryphion nanum]|uniref:Uncharacterized protein n=1 Tax=Dendryphion nanum TaxID=256645 RepID=A0A9P9DXS2_9PLEO|nr:hypothetical protein B0J11DRAFT_505854 [Dendryphion nanum]